MTVKTFLLALVVSLMLALCQSNEDTNDLLTSPLSEAKSEYQKEIIGHLSGEYELANNTMIRSRWSKSERTLAGKYLKELISQLNIEPRENSYRAANLNPAIDLLFSPYKGKNIYGILPSTEPSEEYIILGAHYDSGKRNAPGANDNATGIALIYSVVKELAKSENRSKNILIVFFDQEEEEMIGSKAFVKFLQSQPWDIHSVHCFDMVGWDEDQDFKMGIYSTSESLRNVYKLFAENHGIPLNERIINPVGYEANSTDFDVFVPGGYNVIGGGEDYYGGDTTPFKDTPDDTFETVNFGFLLSSSNFVEDVIKELVK